MSGEATVRRFHVATRNPVGPEPRAPELRPFRRLDPRNAPAPFTRYPNAHLLGLPTDLAPEVAPAATEVLAGRVTGARAGSPVPLDLGLLARLLFFAGGVTRAPSGDPYKTSFRAAASAGNLHPLETYLCTGALPDLDAGLYHFAPDVFQLEQLRAGDHRDLLAHAVTAPDLAQAPATLVITGSPWRTTWKYAERGWRHLYWDTGTMLANLLAVAEAYRVRARLWFGFRDAALGRLLDLDPLVTFPIVVVSLEPTAPADSPAPPASPTPSAPSAAAADPTQPLPLATPLAPDPLELPLLTAAQRAGDLADPDEVRAWRETGRAGHWDEVEETVPPLEDGHPAREPIETVILRRGATRRMRPAEVRPELLTWAMACATRSVPADVLPPRATLLTHFLSVHAVAGLAPGRYRREPTGALAALGRAGEAEARALGAHLCLDQALGGDSAYTLFASADLDRVLGGLGGRGYRVAQTEAGIVVGRLQLAAFALGYGATGLTFYDDEVATAFDTTDACLLAGAVGVPAYRSRPGTTPPPTPAPPPGAARER